MSLLRRKGFVEVRVWLTRLPVRRLSDALSSTTASCHPDWRHWQRIRLRPTRGCLSALSRTAISGLFRREELPPAHWWAVIGTFGRVGQMVLYSFISQFLKPLQQTPVILLLSEFLRKFDLSYFVIFVCRLVFVYLSACVVLSWCPQYLYVCRSRVCVRLCSIFSLLFSAVLSRPSCQSLLYFYSSTTEPIRSDG